MFCVDYEQPVRLFEDVRRVACVKYDPYFVESGRPFECFRSQKR